MCYILQAYLTIKKMNRFPKFFRKINSVHSSSTLSIPEGKDFIAILDDLPVSNEWSGATILSVFREILYKFNVVFFRVFCSKAIYASCSSADDDRNIHGKKLGKIEFFNTSTANYRCFHIHELCCKGRGFLKNTYKK